MVALSVADHFDARPRHSGGHQGKCASLRRVPFQELRYTLPSPSLVGIAGDCDAQTRVSCQVPCIVAYDEGRFGAKVSLIVVKEQVSQIFLRGELIAAVPWWRRNLCHKLVPLTFFVGYFKVDFAGQLFRGT